MPPKDPDMDRDNDAPGGRNLDRKQDKMVKPTVIPPRHHPTAHEPTKPAPPCKGY